MAFTVEEFLDEARFSGFSNLDEDTIASDLDYVLMVVPDSRLCPHELDEGRKFYLAHLLTLSQASSINGMATGAISSLSHSQGSNSVSFGTVDGKTNPNQLNTTIWGLRFQALLQASVCNFQTGSVV